MQRLFKLLGFATETAENKINQTIKSADEVAEEIAEAIKNDPNTGVLIRSLERILTILGSGFIVSGPLTETCSSLIKLLKSGKIDLITAKKIFAEIKKALRGVIAARASRVSPDESAAWRDAVYALIDAVGDWGFHPLTTPATANWELMLCNLGGDWPLPNLSAATDEARRDADKKWPETKLLAAAKAEACRTQPSPHATEPEPVASAEIEIDDDEMKPQPQQPAFGWKDAKP